MEKVIIEIETNKVGHAGESILLVSLGVLSQCSWG